ncbi:hypothetical protein GOQ29_01830 [Clostridium sp. D2Q-14]|uniref:RAMP superfamily CRISPR-associated protein n=1 Tax=Anaeromonas gelatinilytica TaxID=2683194 RepID=UPI00193B62D0|nr:RAMP superfamily CRISPR-associated protein [Anaeromonas gelatinilytica]MBS4534353.1 hypothetical protein [Anaeromonas gelatinilytica]
MGKINIYKIEIEICSEAIFTSGEKEQNLVESRAQTDQYGFVYFHAKTLKGQLKRQAFWLLKQYVNMNKDLAVSFYDSIIKLFGINYIEAKNIKDKYGLELSGESQRSGLMRLSNLELDEKLRNYFIAFQKEDESNKYYRISPHDLIEAQTNIRTGIQLKDGVVKDKMFHTFHTVRKGLVFYSTVFFEEDLSDSVVEDLVRIVYSFRRIGAGIHRGRGEIKSRLLVEGSEIYHKFMDIGGN